MFRDRHAATTPPAHAAATTPSQTPAPAPGSTGVMEQRLREAVAGGKFHLHYQPVVAVADGRLVALEALLRWNSDAGPVAPGTFIPVLEDTGLISDIGPWVLAQACQQASGWLTKNPDLVLAVNVSPNQLVPGFAESVLDIVKITGVAPERLCLDLVRPAAIDDPVVAWGELRRVKGIGVKLFVDDFGALGSSIADLRRFSVDAVKIDSSLVGGLAPDSEDDAIVAALIALAHALGMRAVAEGVETSAQLARLHELGCDLAQGYHLSPPVAPAEVEYILEQAPTTLNLP